MAGLVLGCVFVVAGVLKARDPYWTRTASRFGTSAVLATVLPWVEIVLGALLVVDIGGPWSAVAAAVLLAAFTVVIVRRVAAGDRAPCACFGSIGADAPMSWRTVARNVGLLVLAAVAVAGSK